MDTKDDTARVHVVNGFKRRIDGEHQFDPMFSDMLERPYVPQPLPFREDSELKKQPSRILKRRWSVSELFRDCSGLFCEDMPPKHAEAEIHRVIGHPDYWGFGSLNDEHDIQKFGDIRKGIAEAIVAEIDAAQERGEDVRFVKDGLLRPHDNMFAIHAFSGEDLRPWY